VSVSVSVGANHPTHLPSRGHVERSERNVTGMCFCKLNDNKFTIESTLTTT
jgi:hypothetical protein